MANILIVDDQPYVKEFLSEELAEKDHDIKHIDNAELLQEHLRNSKPDVILLDLFLDGYKGWNLLREIKDEYPNIPVLIVTAYDSYIDDPRLSQADGYIIKSFSDTNSLKRTIFKVLEANQIRDINTEEFDTSTHSL